MIRLPQTKSLNIYSKYYNENYYYSYHHQKYYDINVCRLLKPVVQDLIVNRQIGVVMSLTLNSSSQNSQLPQISYTSDWGSHSLSHPYLPLILYHSH